MTPISLLIDISQSGPPSALVHTGTPSPGSGSFPTAWPTGDAPVIYLHFLVPKSTATLPARFSAEQLIYLGERSSVSTIRRGFTTNSKYKWIRKAQGKRVITVYYELPVKGSTTYKDVDKRRSLEYLVFSQILLRHVSSETIFRCVGGYQFRMNWMRANDVKSDAKRIADSVLANFGV